MWVPFIVVAEAGQQEHEVVSRMATIVRWQREMNVSVKLAFLFIWSKTPPYGKVPPTTSISVSFPINPT